MLGGVRRVIANRGIEETRFSDVAAETNSALSTLQYRFGNWQGMILAALRDANRAELERVSRAAHRTENPVDALRQVLLAAAWADAGPAEAREGWLVWIESWRAAAREPELAAEWRLIHDQWCELIEEILRRGETAGSMTLPLGSHLVATQLLALLDGLSVPLVLQKEVAGPDAVGRLVLDAASAVVRCPELREVPER